MADHWLDVVKRCFCARPNLKERVEALEANKTTKSEIRSCLSVLTKAGRCVYEYDVAFDGTVTGARGGGPALTVAAPIGGDYTLTFSSALINPSINIAVAGDVGTGDGTSTVNNAFIAQNVTFTSATQATYTLFGGDDGAGEDDESRRDVTVYVYEDKQFVCDVLWNGAAIE